MTTKTSWRALVAPYEAPDTRRAVLQILDSFLPYFALWGAMIYTIRFSYWLTLLLAIPAAGFLVRIFIITHDCGHGSFTRSRRLQSLIGFIGGVLTFTPFHYWGHNHAIHHATAGNLDRRGRGDVWTLTLREYRQGSWWLRLRYRLYRNPVTMLLVGPAAMFLVVHRFVMPGDGWRWHRSVMWSNLAIAVVVAGLSLLLGWQTYLAIQLPVILLAGIGGVWLFYVQHQFADVYWARKRDWDYTRVGLNGSSYYRLPRLLQWFSGNIGFHHVHHLSPRIPNYNLERCHRENPEFQKVMTIGLRESLRCMRYRVYDEDAGVMVGLGGA